MEEIDGTVRVYRSIHSLLRLEIVEHTDNLQIYLFISLFFFNHPCYFLFFRGNENTVTIIERVKEKKKIGT